MPTTQGCLTDFAEAKLLDHLCRKTTWTMPTTYLALFTIQPTDAGGGTEIETIGVNGYARVAMSGKWAAAASSAISTNADVDFGPSTGAWDGDVSGWGLYDASSGGNLIAYGALTATTVGTGDTYTIASGNLTLDGSTVSTWTDAVINSLLDHAVGRSAYTAPDIWIALYNGDPLGAGTESHTAGSDGYARQDLDALMGAASGGTISNSSAVTFGPASADWSVATYFAIMSALTAGTVMGGAALGASKTVLNGESAEFAIGDLDITLD